MSTLSRLLWRAVITLAVATWPGSPKAAAAEPHQARRTVAVEVPPLGVVQEAVLRDGSTLYGRVVSVDGEKINFVTVGGGYSENGLAPIVMVGGERRVGRRVAVLTENWIWRGGHGFLSAGVRFLGDRLSADVGLLAPLDGGGNPSAFPLANFVWRF